MQKVCQHCGKEFACSRNDRMEHNIHFYEEKGKGMALERITLCPNCWLDLFDRRMNADDSFYKECVYGTETSKKQATS